VSRYEVFVPAAPPAQAADLRLRVDGDHWLGALKEGLARLGVKRVPANVLCDVHADGSIHVTDADTGRVFRIRELAGAADEKERPGPVGRAEAPPAAEDVLGDLFRRVGAAHKLARREALTFLLDLALEHTRCEAGTVFHADAVAGELAFEAVRGPRAARLATLALKVPIGTGIAGFSARENVCVAVSDAAKDPRFHRAVSDAIGYETRSLLCAPIARGAKVLGVLEVLNKRGGEAFRPTDVAVVAYLAHQAAEVMERKG
jgi:putative methionine-R-sulfoxide reductase with GAF domain